jgi:hypothetical protein
MKYFLFSIIFCFVVTGLRGQGTTVDTSLLGEYRLTKPVLVVFDVYNKGGKMLLQIVGQGQTRAWSMNRFMCDLR